VRPLMGVCPQLDVLWQQLSRQQLVTYWLVKDLRGGQLSRASVIQTLYDKRPLLFCRCFRAKVRLLV
jgi:hypothetical protein